MATVEFRTPMRGAREPAVAISYQRSELSPPRKRIRKMPLFLHDF